MTWLVPLGLLGLLGLIVLIVIYLIKPNYQNKFVSSTYVWRMSLKYKRKRIPINKLINIVTVLCQVLIISLLAVIMASPVFRGDEKMADGDRVIIIDAAANMRAKSDGVTRFERAVEKAVELAEKSIDDGERVSVILAGREVDVIARRAGAEEKDSLLADISKLADDVDKYCSYGASDIDGAVASAESILEENPRTEIELFTAIKYADTGKIKVTDVSDPSEYNVSIIDVRALMYDNYYRFELDAASYCLPRSVTFNFEVYGAKGTSGRGDSVKKYDNETMRFSFSYNLDANKQETFTFGKSELDNISDISIYEYESIFCYVSEKDSIAEDNEFHLYGGRPATLRIQYYSTKSNSFVSGMLLGMREKLRDEWNIIIDEIQDTEEDVKAGDGKSPALRGYDLYIFEHHMPEVVPTDGVVVMIDPDNTPAGETFVLGDKITTLGNSYLYKDENAPITSLVRDGVISVSQYTEIKDTAEYTPILYLDKEKEKPAVLFRNDKDTKVVLFSFSLHYSNLPLMPEFPIMFMSILDELIPTTFDKHVYDTYSKVDINSRSDEITVTAPIFEEDVRFTEFPLTIDAAKPGKYTVVQTPISGIKTVESFFVTIPDQECNIAREVDSLENPYYPAIDEPPAFDPILIIALALFTLLLIEWWLKMREQY